MVLKPVQPTPDGDRRCRRRRLRDLALSHHGQEAPVWSDNEEELRRRSSSRRLRH
jgi:hypothetical protein